MGARLIRINDEIFKELANILRAELKDPRINAMVSVVKVETTNDLKYCKIHVSVLGDEQQKKDVMSGLKNANGFIRKLIAERVNLRVTPELTFILDESLEYGMRMSKLIDEVNAPLRERED